MRVLQQWCLSDVLCYSSKPNTRFVLKIASKHRRFSVIVGPCAVRLWGKRTNIHAVNTLASACTPTAERKHGGDDALRRRNCSRACSANCPKPCQNHQGLFGKKKPGRNKWVTEGGGYSNYCKGLLLSLITCLCTNQGEKSAWKHPKMSINLPSSCPGRNCQTFPAKRGGLAEYGLGSFALGSGSTGDVDDGIESLLVW